MEATRSEAAAAAMAAARWTSRWDDRQRKEERAALQDVTQFQRHWREIRCIALDVTAADREEKREGTASADAAAAVESSDGSTATSEGKDALLHPRSHSHTLILSSSAV